MKKLLLGVALTALMTSASYAETIGVSMALFDDNFLTVLRNGIQADADKMGVTVQIEDAQNDVAKQLDQIKNFAASGVDAIIVNPVDTSATQAMTDAAAAAGVPLVYVNREPINVDALPDGQAFVASNEVDSGTLETKEICRLLKEAGKSDANVYVMMGELSNQAAVQRTKDIHDVMDSGECGVTLNIIDEQTANWSRDQAQNLMTNWLSTGQAVRRRDLQQRRDGDRRDPGDEGRRDRHEGRDRRRRRRHAGRAGWRCRRGDLDVTVFQNAAGPGRRLARRGAEARQGRGRGQEGLRARSSW